MNYKRTVNYSFTIYEHAGILSIIKLHYYVLHVVTILFGNSFFLLSLLFLIF